MKRSSSNPFSIHSLAHPLVEHLAVNVDVGQQSAVPILALLVELQFHGLVLPCREVGGVLAERLALLRSVDADEPYGIATFYGLIEFDGVPIHNARYAHALHGLWVVNFGVLGLLCALLGPGLWLLLGRLLGFRRLACLLLLGRGQHGAYDPQGQHKEGKPYRYLYQNPHASSFARGPPKQATPTRPFAWA